jgi:DNA-binding CsgD family transcriptional regulator
MIIRRDTPTSPPVLIERSSSAPAVLAEFCLGNTHCLVVSGNGELGRSLDADDTGMARLLGNLDLDGQRYAVYARTDAAGSGRHIDDAQLTSLTARELQIIRLVCLGHVNKQIAHKLHISEYTVKTYLKQIFCKLNVHSRSAMVFRCASWTTVGLGNGDARVTR